MRTRARCTLISYAIGFLPAIGLGQDCTQWSLRAVGGAVPPNYAHAMSFDSHRGVTVLFGGNTGCPISGTWEWDGSTWTARTSANAPQPLGGVLMAFDAARGVTILFGGGGPGCGSPAVDTTWEWDGVDWTLRSVFGPEARSSSRLVYDSARQKIVLYGGWGNSAPCLSDTWEYDGVAWTQLFPAQSPGPRRDAAMAFDASSGRTILFGGTADGANYLGDTWAWDGTTWTPLATGVGSISTRMVYDSQSGRIIRYDSGQLSGSDTFEWDGSQWVRFAVANPPNRYNYDLAFDSWRGRVVLYGGHDASGLRADTWEFRNAVPATIQAQPEDLVIRDPRPIVLSVSATGTGPLTYRWRKEGVPLANLGRVSGADTPTLTISPPEPAFTGTYDCVVTGPCNTATSRSASVLIPCLADVDDGSGTGTPDGGVTIDDLLFFLFRFENGC